MIKPLQLFRRAAHQVATGYNLIIILISQKRKYFAYALQRSLSSFGQAPKLNPGQHKSKPGRGSILLPPRAAVLPRLDAGSGSVKPTSSCVIQNLQTSCSSWYMMYET